MISILAAYKMNVTLAERKRFFLCSIIFNVAMAGIL